MDPLSLEDVLRDKYCINCENKSFIPSNELSQILTDPAIRHILHQKLQCDDDDLERLIAQILNDDIGNGHKKIFAILVIIGKVKYIKDFIHASVRDADLPLDLEYLRGRLANCKIHYLEAFYERQWLVIVPVLNFTVDIVPPKYSAREILPILEKKRIGGGAHGILWKVQIHPGHIRGNKSQDSHFALKQVDDRSQWEDELNALRHFSGQHAGHDHLIQLLLAYEHEDIGFFLVFPFAEGNLKQYWESNISRYPTFGHAYWLVEQCLGLAAALRKVHRHDSWPGDDRGRHGDIKPENVLWFKGSGVDHGRLVIADFSLTRFHRNDTVENTVPGERGFSSAYRPPEVDAQPRIQAAQRFDVWSLGCLFLEFIAWYLVGYSATRGRGDIVDHFGEGYKSFMHARLMDDDRSRDGIDQDKFFNITDRRAGLARVKLSVTAWMIFLHRSKNCSEAIHAILNLIENGMLLPEPTARFEMARVAIDLTEILKKCERKDYCLREQNSQLQTNRRASVMR
ncbi:kinase-like domain-containing protein [Nemania abortiva]|nr:kinase-like domain-containing protein [Nemania abortiva]